MLDPVRCVLDGTWVDDGTPLPWEFHMWQEMKALNCSYREWQETPPYVRSTIRQLEHLSAEVAERDRERRARQAERDGGR